MKTILVGECRQENTFELRDPDSMLESEFEYKVASALMCQYSRYFPCYPFSGRFKFDDDFYKPDLALVARDFSHWFVIEVELSSHSFSDHVLPQVRALRWGEPQNDCLPSLQRGTGCSAEQARTLLCAIPRSVAVVANKYVRDWEIMLSSLDVQFLSAQVFNSKSGVEAVEVSGQMQTILESLGFGRFSAIDRTLRFPKSVRLPDGVVQINDPDGGAGHWTVIRDGKFAWVQKNDGMPDLEDGKLIQLVRAIGGRIIMRRPPTA